MNLPNSLWPNAAELALLEGLTLAFEQHPLLLTDQLVNVVYVNDEAERLLGDRAGAIVNRLSLSLLGFGYREKIPESLLGALLGTAPPWRGVVHVGEEGPVPVFAEASAVVSGGRLVCGVIRLGRERAIA